MYIILYMQVFFRIQTKLPNRLYQFPALFF